MNKQIMLLVIICFTFFNSALYGQWEIINYPGDLIHDFVINDIDLFAIKKSAVIHSTDNGSSWNSINNGLEEKSVYALAIKGDILLAGTSEGLFSSTDNGNTWIMVGLSEKSVRAIVVSESNIFLGTDSSGVLLSKDNGASWIDLNNGLASMFVGDLTINGHTLVARTSDALFVSTDNGGQWNQAGLTNSFFTSLLVSGGIIFAGTYFDGLFYSTDNGLSWNLITNGLNSKIVGGIALTSTYLFVGMGNGVFHSTDNGTSWHKTGLTRWVKALAASETELFVSTRKGGGGPGIAVQLHRLDLSSVHITPQPESITGHNQPKIRINNASNAIKMYYKIQSSCFVQLDLYTLSGVHVASCVNEQRTAGEYCHTINKNSLPAGLYTCHFNAGSYKEDASVLIMK